MSTIRDLFHEIGNWHNKVSVAAGLAKATLKSSSKFNSKESTELLNLLSSIEKNAIGADKVLIKLKDAIYSIMDTDTGKPK